MIRAFVWATSHLARFSSEATITRALSGLAVALALSRTSVRTHLRRTVHTGETVVTSAEQVLTCSMPAAIFGTDALLARWARKASVTFAYTTLRAAAVIVAGVGAFLYRAIQPGVAFVTEAMPIRFARAEPGAIVQASLGRA